jgi:hypothetical protein
MQGLSSDFAEVRAMLVALVPKVDSCKEPLSAQELGNICCISPTTNRIYCNIFNILSVQNFM